MAFELESLGFYAFQSICPMIEFDESGCMDLISVFPSVVTFWVTFPFDQVLQGFVLPLSPVCADLFHFIFFFSINQIRGRLRKVGTVCWHFNIGHQKTGVKDGMDTPLGWEFELYSD
jgi:hypothetical protein